ncbi:hypothetical protein WJX73_000043 [Symbiochloris irregularis]|uniref:Protein kinase domain-containing protein n=1 Tax=Symbiochloris irregularis TaxID=706552 RepID=A0AAW1PJ17_9CHLO
MYKVVGAAGYTEKGVLRQKGPSIIKLMEKTETKILVAAMFIPRDALTSHDKHGQGNRLFRAIEREIILHRSLVHRNIIRFREVFTTDTHLVIVQSYPSGGNIEEKLQLTGPFDEFTARKLFRQLVEGVEYCHKRRVYHRRLRTSNILLHGSVFEAKVKLSDFSHARSGYRCSINEEDEQFDPVHSPPELFGTSKVEPHERDDGALDVWAMGLVLYRMLTASHPFLDPGNPSCISKSVMERLSTGQILPLDENSFTPSCLDIITKMFQPDPNYRIEVWLCQTQLAGQ